MGCLFCTDCHRDPIVSFLTTNRRTQETRHEVTNQKSQIKNHKYSMFCVLAVFAWHRLQRSAIPATGIQRNRTRTSHHNCTRSALALLRISGRSGTAGGIVAGDLSGIEEAFPARDVRSGDIFAVLLRVLAQRLYLRHRSHSERRPVAV